MGVIKGDKVRIHYIGRLEDGTVFDSSQDRAPLEFTAGSEEVIFGVSQAVLGMEPGDSKTVEIRAEEGFGLRQDGMEQRVPLAALPHQVKIGDALQAQLEDRDDPLVVWVTEINEDSAVVDANHPLSGHDLTFDIEMVEVSSDVEL